MIKILRKLYIWIISKFRKKMKGEKTFKDLKSKVTDFFMSVERYMVEVSNETGYLTFVKQHENQLEYKIGFHLLILEADIKVKFGKVLIRTYLIDGYDRSKRALLDDLDVISDIYGPFKFMKPKTTAETSFGSIGREIDVEFLEEIGREYTYQVNRYLLSKESMP